MKPATILPFFKRPGVAIVLAMLILAGLALVLYASGAFMPAFDPEKRSGADYDVIYCTMDGVDLGMDFYYPDSGGPWPVLLFVHGGGWTEGDKSSLLIKFTESGYLVASLNYRMYPNHRFPAMIEDVKCAIRFLRAHARQYNLDPDRIALIGHSAGGHLVALAGLADRSAGWDVGQYSFRSSRVQAVVVLSAPSDLTRTFPAWVDELLQGVFGAGQLISGSPVTYASPDDPPVLIIHGDADPAVPVEQAYLLQAALISAGVPVELLIVQNGGHGLEPVGNVTIPAWDGIFQKVMIFLEQHLGRIP